MTQVATTMDFGYLTCNFKDCYKELKDVACVTFCSHIFCVDHGKDMKANLSKGCPVCKTELSEHQILEKNLQMTENSATLFLSGHNPSTIWKLTSSAIGFWNYQKKHEYLIMKRDLEHCKQKLQTQAKAIDEVMKELGVKIEATKKENEQLIDENLKLKVDLASKAEEMLRDEKRLKTN